MKRPVNVAGCSVQLRATNRIELPPANCIADARKCRGFLEIRKHSVEPRHSRSVPCRRVRSHLPQSTSRQCAARTAALRIQSHCALSLKETAEHLGGGDFRRVVVHVLTAHCPVSNRTALSSLKKSPNHLGSSDSLRSTVRHACLTLKTKTNADTAKPRCPYSSKTKNKRRHREAALTRGACPCTPQYPLRTFSKNCSSNIAVQSSSTHGHACI